MICGGRSLSFTQFGCQEIDLQGHAKRGWSRREEVAAARVGRRFIWANAQCGCREALSAAGYRAPRRSGTGPSRPIGARSNACDAVRRRVRGCAWGAAKLSRYGVAIARWQFDVIRCLAIGRHNPRGSTGALCRGVRRTPAAWHESPQRNCLAADSRGASPSGSASSGRSNGSDLGSDPNATRLSVNSIMKTSCDEKTEYQNGECAHVTIMSFARTPLIAARSTN
jgi:hypothetical protein